MSKIDEKASDVKDFKSDYVQLQVERYDGMDPDAQRDFIEDVLEKREKLKKR